MEKKFEWGTCARHGFFWHECHECYEALVSKENGITDLPKLAKKVLESYVIMIHTSAFYNHKLNTPWKSLSNN